MAFTDVVSPKKVQDAVNRGFKRLDNFRHARVMFLRNYVGPNYDREKGDVGKEPLNLIYNALRVLIPNIVLSFPKHTIQTPYLQAKQYAELLALALQQQDRQLNIRDTYRRVLVDSLFTLGILKTGLAQSQSIYGINDEDGIDTGTIYTEAVDFDNFVADPNSKEHLFKDAAFTGDRMTVPRRMLLESGLYANDLIERLPRAGQSKKDKAYEMSMHNITSDENYDLEDQVEIVELYVPSANALVTVPGAKEVSFDDYLRVDDFYGLKDGPYTFLALSPPTPGNPMPVPPIGVWNDLHVCANRMASKIVEQAERQKDLLFYKRAASDDAEEARNAGDGDAIAVDDPDAMKTASFGGQQNSNETHLAQLQSWFNMMAGNPNQLGGQAVPANSATAATILQNNSTVALEDMKDAVYQTAASEARKRAWYLHTDPLMQVPLTKRQPMPPQIVQGPMGPTITPPTMQEVQVILTPEMRSGDFLDYTFDIMPESMGRLDSRAQFQQGLEFTTKIIPSALQAAQSAMMLGIPFSAKAYILHMAKAQGMDWIEEVFYDPEFQQQMMQQMMMGPQNPGKGQAAPAGGQVPLQSNGQMTTLPNNPTPQAQNNAAAQDGANSWQQTLKQGTV